MIDSVGCDTCGLGMECVSKITLDHGYTKHYECDCGEFYTVTVSYASNKGKENRKAQSNDECDCCDGSCKEPIGQCDDYKEDVKDPVKAEYGEECCKESDDYHEEKCCAPESRTESITELETQVKRLELEKKILDLDDDIYHRRRRENER